MRKVGTDELKKIQVEILDVVAKFCDENGIKYWLDSGTLLGAIRHKGYIPWDDDIDIGMLRPDYNRFLKEFNELSERYKVYSIENNPAFEYPYAKVLDLSTILYEPDVNGNKLSINIDIFVYDNAPADAKTLKRMYDRRDRFRWMYNHRIGADSYIGKVAHCILSLLPARYYVDALARNSRRLEKYDMRGVGNFTAYTRMYCEKRVFDRMVSVEFEGKTYSAPEGYDEWLRAFYGDYMKLPPIEKRVSHHSFVAYVEE